MFVGRDRELTDLHNALQRADRVAIAAIGMGGIGKTTLARRYVKQHEADYPGGIWWVAAERMATQVLEYAGRSVGLEELPTDWTQDRIMQHYLSRWAALFPQRKLLVIDDVGEYEEIKGFLPQQGAFQVMITTRSQMPPPVESLPLGVLEPSAALQLLSEVLGEDARSQDESAVAAVLCEWLGYLPLGLELVAQLLRLEPDWSIAELLADLQREQMQHESMGAVEAAFELSWQRLNQAECQLAAALSLFAVAPIPWALVEPVVGELLDGRALGLARRRLVGLSLLNRVGKKRYQLHGLVRLFLQAKREGLAEADSLQRGFAQGMTDVAKTIPQAVTLAVRSQVTEAVPHMEEVAAQWTEVLEGTDKLWCCIGLARFYESLSQWQDAERCRQREFAVSQTQLGDRHPDTATSLNNLAELYRSQGRYEEAKPLCVKALKIRKTELGDRHPDTATSLNNLATLYFLQGRYGKAEPLYVEALNIRKTELGDRHPVTAQGLHNLALLYYYQGRYGEAEPLYVEALEIWETELGDHHPDTAQGLNDLALLYKSQGQYAKAEPLYVEALNIRKVGLGDRHPNTAQSLNNLAALYDSQRRYVEAEPLFVEALEIRKTELGDRHPDTAQGLNNLAALYQSQGRYVEAEPLLVEALEIRKTELGDRNPDTAQSLNNLAILYASQGRYVDAELLYVETLEISKTKLGDRHPSTATSLFNLAALYHQTQRHQQALSYIQQALDIYQSTLGSEHPNTQLAQGWLVGIQQAVNESA